VKIVYFENVPVILNTIVEMLFLLKLFLRVSRAAGTHVHYLDRHIVPTGGIAGRVDLADAPAADVPVDAKPPEFRVVR
jgi:hypothetical protein